MDKLREWLESKGIEDGDEIVKMAQSFADAEISRIVEKHDLEYARRFNEEKLPKMLEEERQKIRQELNPEETPEQKRIRELEDRIAKADREREINERRAALRKKATDMGISEIGLSADDFEALAVLGDSADSMLESIVTKTKSAWQESLDGKIKEKFASAPAPEGSPADEPDQPRGADYVAKRLEGSFLG